MEHRGGMEHRDGMENRDSPIHGTTVAILGGSGELGQGLSVRLARAGVSLIIGSRSEWTATEAVEELAEMFPGLEVRGMLNPAAVEHADIVFLCVPFAHQADTVESIRDSLRPGHIVVDAIVPLAAAVGGKPTRTLGVWQGSAAEQAQDLVPEGVVVVSALHTVSGSTLQNLDRRLDEDVLVCGDRKAEKERVMKLLECIDGLRAVDCGQLEQARIVESMTALLIGINIRHKTHAGIRITGLPASPSDGSSIATPSAA
jgi:8-hydroxy-5-deazaflavin:NADPH oxidoreductase